jgi:hypothetical protein
MSTPQGLGQPRGPHFLSPVLPQYAPAQAPAPVSPGDGKQPGRWFNRAMIALIAVLVARASSE